MKGGSSMTASGDILSNRMKRLFVAAALLITACAPTIKVEQYGKGMKEVREDELPRQVAILPFANETDEPGLDILVRRNFANHFSATSYQEMKLPVVDEKLVRLEKSSGRPARETSERELAAALGVDGLLFGKVTDYQKIYAGIYSRLGVEAEVWMVNASSGQELFRLRESVRYHEGGVPTSPLAAVVTAVSTALNLRDIQKVRLINELCNKLMEKVPSPSSAATAEHRPVIREVLTNLVEGPFGPKKVIKVGVQGDPGLVASFAIGSFRRGVPLKEMTPGIYAGEYAVLPGDTTRDMPLTVTLTRPGGLETEWLDVSGFVTIDTTPPPPVTALRAKGQSDRIELTWEGVKQVPDLKGYRVLRSDSPLTGYQELGIVETAAYTDQRAAPGRGYYYRVVPVDLVGNGGEPSDPVRAMLTAAEPLPLSGIIAGDRLLEGSYLVTGSVTVPHGVTLTLAPETRLRFAAGQGVTVQGRLIAAGGEGEIALLADGDGGWSGVTIDGGRVELERLRLQGAETGIAITGGEGRLARITVTGCGTGVSMEGPGALDLREVTLSGNKVGLRLTRSMATVTGSTIVQNGRGVELDAFSGRLEGNNIFDNQVNIAATTPQKVGPNYLGSVQLDDLRLEQVTVEQLYNDRLPGGALAAPQVDPYRNLTAEERQRRQAELLVEGGDFFRKRNFGRAATLFTEALKVAPTPDIYYYLALVCQEMQEGDKAMRHLQDGVARFPQEANLWKALGILAYERGERETSRHALDEALRLSPDDRQARFVREQLTDEKKP